MNIRIGFSTLLTSLALLATLLPANEQSITFLGQTYRLASHNQKASPMWEFVRQPESVDNWNTLLTLVERPGVRSREDLDRLSEGTLDTYKAHGGRVLKAQTMKGPDGAPYNYMVVAFEQAAQKRFELNFVKAALNDKSAYVLVYGVRITDPADYTTKAKAFLNDHSSEIGKALEQVTPSTSTLPRRVF